MPFLNRDGVELYYEQHGAGEAAILLSHGYSATSSMWRGQVEALRHILAMSLSSVCWWLRATRRARNDPNRLRVLSVLTYLR